MLEKHATKSAVHLQQLLSGIICASCLTSSFVQHHLCVLPPFLSPSLTFCRPYIKKTPIAFPSPLSAFLLLIPTVSSSLPPSFPPFLSSSHKLFRHCVSLVLPLQCPGCITAPSPSNGFPMLRPSYLSRGHVSSLGSITL